MKVKAKKKEAVKSFIFTGENINEIIERQANGELGIPRHMNPWYKNESGVRRKGLVYGWTQDEINEHINCALDVNHFANNYCKIKSEDGQTKQMLLRDYQYGVLNTYTKNSRVINMSSRQSGKCKDLITNILVKENNIIKKIPAFKILFKYKENKTIYDIIKYPIYWILWKINS